MWGTACSSKQTLSHCDEYIEDAPVLEGLKEIQGLMNIFHKILQPLSRQAGVGYKILAVLATAEASAVLGALDSNLLCTSIRQASRGATAVIFGMKSFISLYANTI